ncbi:MAG: MobA/MobL family protein [Magnetospirillum sp.]|nr:MobA/MobL family protein [Magnetospirillum sp.]
MAKGKDISEWDRLKAGQLDEHEATLLESAGSRSRGQPALYLRRRILSRARRSAPAGDRVEHIPNGQKLPKWMQNSLKLAPFHFSHTFVSRQKTFSLPPSVLSGKRVALYPQRRDLVALNEVKGVIRNSRHRVWTIAPNHPFLETTIGIQLRSNFAAISRALENNKASNFKKDSIASRFQAYLERTGENEKTREKSIESDAKGEISFGNLGATSSERVLFWNYLAQFERRADARLQCRIIGELPHWISASERRRIMEEFCKIFEEKRLPFWAVCHKPDVEIGSDPRNFHFHIIYSDRPFSEDIEKEKRLSDKKDRTAQGEAWIKFLKKRMADTVNSQLVETALLSGEKPERLFFEGTYKDLGIEVAPLHHRGPKETALSRNGILSKTEKKNIEIIEAQDDAEIESLRRLFEKLGSDAIAILETYQKDSPKQPSITNCNHQKMIETEETRLLSAIDLASNILLQLYDSIRARHYPLTHPHTEQAITRARGRERQNNKNFSPSATVLERYLGYLSSLDDDGAYTRLAESVAKNEGISDIKTVISLRQLLDCDFQNLTRRLRSALEEAENALSSLKRRIENFERISKVINQREAAREGLRQSNSQAEAGTGEKAQNSINTTIPSQTTSVTQAQNRQFLHGSNRGALRLSADQMYSNPTQSRRPLSLLTKSIQQNPEKDAHLASEQTSKSSSKQPEKSTSTTRQSDSIADLLNNQQSKNRSRNSNHEM